ncbi:hypothetical protein B0H11DRAFT_1720317 [Mycena galericulata]|nr:hypothetical protein B0H11DRAFT_1720317 [Mycena galericulata]
MPDIPNEFVPSPAWEEGTEEYSHLSVDQLWVLIGLPDKAIPFFNTKLDPTGLHNPWTDEGNAFFEDDRNSKINLTPRWHQLVGLYKMMNMAFIAEPVVLMDEVGLGKTLQSIALVACLAYYRDYYQQKNISLEHSVYHIRYHFNTMIQALSSDGEQLYKLEARKPSGPLIKDPKFRRVSSATLYCQSWLLAGIDEAHVCRNLNKTHIACRAFREASSCTVAMTATPVTTRILDRLTLLLSNYPHKTW